MNTKDEIVDAFDGVRHDLPPPAIFTQTGTVGQMEKCGAFWPDACMRKEPMVDLALQLSRMFGFAIARVPYCGTVEAERLGAKIKEGEIDRQPSVLGSPYSTDMDVAEVPDSLMDSDEFVAGGRCETVAEACEDISRNHPELFLTAGMQDPVSLAMQFLGTENMIIAFMMEPDLATRWVRMMVPYTCAYASRLSEVADNVLVVAEASTDILSPEMYSALSEPNLPKTVSAIRSSFSTVHSCGDTRSILEGLLSSGPDGLSVEASADPGWFLERVGGRCRMFGSVSPVGTLLSKEPSEVRDEARMYADLGFDAVTPECGVPPRTPDENLRALASYRD